MRPTGVVLVLLALLAGCGVESRAGLYWVAELQPGDCLDLPEDVAIPWVERPLPILECSNPHDYEVYETFWLEVTAGAGDPFGGDQLGRQLGPPGLPDWMTGVLARCEAGLAPYAGAAAAELAWMPLYTADPDRLAVVCVLLDAGHGRLERSMAGGTS